MTPIAHSLGGDGYDIGNKSKRSDAARYHPEIAHSNNATALKDRADIIKLRINKNTKCKLDENKDFFITDYPFYR